MHKHERMFKHEHAHKLDDPERRTWLPPEEVIAELGLSAGQKVVDLGVGTGYFALPIARALGPEGRVAAVDMQPEMLSILSGRIEGLSIDLVHGEATRTTLVDGSNDLVFIANVWHELDDVDAALREFARITRPGGKIAILDWRPDVERPPGPPLDHRIGPDKVVASLRAHGIATNDTKNVGRYSYLVIGVFPSAA